MATATMDMYVARRSQERNAGGSHQRRCVAGVEIGWEGRGRGTSFCSTVISCIGIVVVKQQWSVEGALGKDVVVVVVSSAEFGLESVRSHFVWNGNEFSS